MEKAWNADKQQFGQCYEETDVLDSAVLIMPLVFFIQPVGLDPSPAYICIMGFVHRAIHVSLAR
jgi:hypothetical protein